MPIQFSPSQLVFDPAGRLYFVDVRRSVGPNPATVRVGSIDEQGRFAAEPRSQCPVAGYRALHVSATHSFLVYTCGDELRVDERKEQGWSSRARITELMQVQDSAVSGETLHLLVTPAGTYRTRYATLVGDSLKMGQQEGTNIGMMAVAGDGTVHMALLPSMERLAKWQLVTLRDQEREETAIESGSVMDVLADHRGRPVVITEDDRRALTVRVLTENGWKALQMPTQGINGATLRHAAIDDQDQLHIVFTSGDPSRYARVRLP